jgi:thiazole synthase
MLTIHGTTFTSRLFLGTGKCSLAQLMRQAIEASGAEMLTVALRQVDISNPDDDIMMNLDRQRYSFLPNTSGARNSDEAIRETGL